MNHPFNDPGLASPPSPYDEPDMYEVTLILKTWVNADSPDDALETVHNSLPIQFEFGDRDAYTALPFEYDGMLVKPVKESDLPRP